MDHPHAPGPADTYEHYLGPALFVPCARLLLAEAAPRPGEKAVDVACGTGILTRRLAPMLGENGRITGVDISPDMLAVARSRPRVAGAPIDWREGSADSLPVPDHSAELLLCQQGIQFFPDRIAALRQMRRVLHDDGRVAIAVWKTLEYHAVFRILMEAESEYLGVPLDRLAVPFSFGDAGTLHDLLAETGYREIRITEASLVADLPEPDRFIELTVTAGAAVIPELDKAESAERAALVDAVKSSTRDAVAHYRDGNRLKFPMHTLLATARI